MKSSIILGLVLCLLSRSAVFSSAQCAQGCTGATQAVSAVDGLPYLNSCVAKCQGAQISNSRDVAMQPGGQRPVSEAVILAHASRGYNFVNFARVRRVKANMRGNQQSTVSAPTLDNIPQNRVLLYDATTGGIYASAAAGKLPASAAVSYAAAAGTGGAAYVPPQQTPASPAPQGDSELLNPDIEVDVTPTPQPAADSSDNLVTPPLMDVGTVGRRRLQRASRKLQMVQTPDERVEVAAKPADLPMSAVGQLLGHGQQWHCSASLIAERTIITAAHCVFDRSTGAFARGLYFIPGRFRDSANQLQAPFGGFDVAEVYIMSQYVSGAPQDIWASDMAVVRLVETAQIGKVVGHLGINVPAAAAAQPAKGAAVVVAESSDIRPTSATVAARKARNNRRASPGGSAVATPSWQGSLVSAGYPSDKPEGTLVSMNCDAEQYSGSSASDIPAATLKLKCSTQLGQSGSPLVNANRQLQGVISFEVAGADGYNGGCAVTSYLWENLIKPNLV